MYYSQDKHSIHQIEKNMNQHDVYAFHTFMATVEGQVTVMRGDALTLLDDTNAYWWLVKVMKTSEIGFIPAEIIETPLERLARINKYRNAKIILDSSIHENKKKSPLKKVKISDHILIQTMTVTTDINDIPIMATYDVLEGEIGDLLNEKEVDDDDEQEEEEDEDEEEDVGIEKNQHHNIQDLNMIPQENELQPCTTISNQQNKYIHSSQSIIEKTNNIRKFLSNQRNSLMNSHHPIETPPSSFLKKKEQEEEELSILRIFAGNINVNATFNSVLVNENTTADQLLSYALERFRLENQQSNGIEYYITVKVMNKDEIILSSQDKPLAIFHSLTTHLTTPMPSFIHDQSKIQLTRLGVSKWNSEEKSSFGQDSVIKFYLHKRIKRRNEQNDQLMIKIAYYTPMIQQTPKRFTQLVQFSKRHSFNLKHGKHLSLSSSSPSIQPMERIEKLINVSSSMRITDLTIYALEKFHIQYGVPYTHENENMDKYGMTLVINGKENVLNGKKRIVDIFDDEWLMPKGAENPLFVLRKMQSRISSSSSTSEMKPKNQHQQPNHNSNPIHHNNHNHNHNHHKKMYNVRCSNLSPNALPLVPTTKPNSISNPINNKLTLTSGLYNPSDTSLPSSILSASSASSTSSSASSTSSASSSSSSSSFSASSFTSPCSTPISTSDKMNPDDVLSSIDVTLSAFEKDLSFNNLSVYHASLYSTYPNK
ncbi:unnamed protein product [Cunninghamella blakesleeana]